MTMDARTINEAKKNTLDVALSKGLHRPQGMGMTKIMVDARIGGVSLPTHLMGREGVPLNLSRRFRYPIELKDDGVHTTLNFQAVPVPIVIPWEAIQGIGDCEGNIYFWDNLSNKGYMIPTGQGEPGMLTGEPEVLLDRTAELKLKKIEGDAQLTPPRTGHLRLLN